MRQVSRPSYRLPLGKTLRRIRESLGWSRDKMARECGVTSYYVRNGEYGDYEIPVRYIEKVREVTGIDPYVMSYLEYANVSKLPKPVQEKFAAIRKEWERQLQFIVRAKTLIPGVW